MALREKLLILGGSGFLGAEVARLAVALGHDVTSISPGAAPPTEDPWTHGVRWVRGRAQEPRAWSEELDGAHALIVCTDLACLTEELWTLAENAGIRRGVLISPGRHAPLFDAQARATGRSVEQTLQRTSLATVVLRPDLVFGPERPVSALSAALARLGNEQPHEFRPLRREIVAMATLRAALEDERAGVLEVDDIAHLGDAMMIQ